MGLGARIKGIFRRKKAEVDMLSMGTSLPEIEIPRPVAPAELPRLPTAYGDENVRAKMDLIATHLESLKVQYETLNERVARIEKMLNEIYVIAKRS